MFTVCPKCALTLVVTAADLRIAQGYVRCGRCLNVFNALARLSEERPSGMPASPPDTAAAEEPEHGAIPQAPAPSAPDDTNQITGEIEIELDPGMLVSSADPPAPAPETAAPQERAAEAPATEPSPSPSLSATSTEPTDTRAQPQDPTAAEVTDIARDPAVTPASAAASPTAETPSAQQTNIAERTDDALELVTHRPRPRLAWTLGAGVLALILALQVVNHHRDTLAADPALRGALSTVYSALGVKLAPHWNVEAYDVRQLGASVTGETAGEIVVRASVKNAASRAQPLPLLRVTLQDRFGNRIAARDVPPRDYLPSSVAPGALLAAGSRVDATMVFVDPGPQAVGFEIDACLPQQSGEVACAHGP